MKHATKDMGAHKRAASGRDAHHAGMVHDFKKRFRICLLMTVPILALSSVFRESFGLREVLRFNGDRYVLFVLSSFVYIYGGYPFFSGLADELKAKKPGMMTLVAVAITAAFLYSSAVTFGLPGMDFFWELVSLVDIMLLGQWIEMRSVMGASGAIDELVRLMPSEAHKLMPDGNAEDVPLSDLNVGDRVLVKPGEKIPADGAVIGGETSVNEAMLTGESRPIPKEAGGKIIGGSLNGEGSITVEIRKAGKASFLSQVIELVRRAQESKSRTQDLANRAASWLTLVALGGGALTFALWVILSGKDMAFSLEGSITVMVIACPHALGLAVPLVVAVSTALSASNGLLIRDRAAFERGRNIKAVIFDKTGTLTEGRFGVTDVIAFTRQMDDKELVKYAAAIEKNSEHPIAKGIVSSSANVYTVEKFSAIPGRGAEGRVNGKDVKIVSAGYLKERGKAVVDQRIKRLSSQGKTVVFVVVNDTVVGAIALADIIRPESKKAIAMLKRMGIQCIMLTGDNRQVAKWVSGEIGLDEYFAEVLPQDKSAKIREVQSRGVAVAMTGDGVNDAPALAQADVGIAIGAGTDVAVETADIVLVRSNPLDVVAIIELARATYRKMAQNLAWATGYNVLAIPLAAGVLYQWGFLLSPSLGIGLMSASTMIVVINARFLRAPHMLERGKIV